MKNHYFFILVSMLAILYSCSSNESNIASEKTVKPCPGTPTVTYNGKTYNTVQIGNQCWLKENLDVGTMIDSNRSSDNGVIEKYCYDNDSSNCDKYGGLYEWNEVMQYVTTEWTQGICPDGWHITTNSEFLILEAFLNDEATKVVEANQTTSGYTATNESGFSALFSGYRNNDLGSFYGLGTRTCFWTSTETSSNTAVRVMLGFDYSGIHFGDGNYDKNDGFCIRCLKD